MVTKRAMAKAREEKLRRQGFETIFMNFKSKRSAQNDARWFRRNKWRNVAVVDRGGGTFVLLAKGKRVRGPRKTRAQQDEENFARAVRGFLRGR